MHDRRRIHSLRSVRLHSRVDQQLHPGLAAGPLLHSSQVAVPPMQENLRFCLWKSRKRQKVKSSPARESRTPPALSSADDWATACILYVLYYVARIPEGERGELMSGASPAASKHGDGRQQTQLGLSFGATHSAVASVPRGTRPATDLIPPLS